MSKEQVMDYVMNSPANTNPNVLSGMLDSVAQSGGGTVEVSKIKIGTITGAGDNIVTNQIGFSVGGGRFTDNKTFAELIGDKTLIGFRASLPSVEGETLFDISTGAVVGTQPTSTYYVDPLLSSGEAVDNALFFYTEVMYSGKSSVVNGKPIDIYAICI